MKLAPLEAIRTGEKELMDIITGDLDWAVLGEVFTAQHHLDLGENVEFKRGDLVVHENRVAYQLQFEVTVNMCVLLDRQGNFLALANSLPEQGQGEAMPASPQEPLQERNESEESVRGPAEDSPSEKEPFQAVWKETGPETSRGLGFSEGPDRATGAGSGEAPWMDDLGRMLLDEINDE